MSSADGAAGAISTRTFGLRLGLYYATLFVLGSILIVLLTYLLTSASLAQRDQQILQAKLGEYATVYARGGMRGLVDTVQAEQRTAPERLYVRVVDRGREAVLLSMPEGWEASTLETRSVRLLDGTLVEVGKSSEARLDLLGRFRATLGLVTLSIVILALTGGWIATQSAVQPIRRLTQAVRRIIATGRTDERVPAGGQEDDAIHELTVLFNAMLDKIEGLVRSMRGSLDNVSHDLRTPLTRLRGTAELALAGPDDLERYRDALVDCVEESDRVLVMLNTLMDISEAESGAMPLTRERLRLAEIVARAVELYRDVAEAKGVTLHVGAERLEPGAAERAPERLAAGEDGEAPALSVFADRVRLEQVAANLLDNALKYTPEGGDVFVDVGRDGDRATLIVRDTGIGIPEDELPRIWDRLFRGDASRTERGLGLGLSLVKAVVEAHGGSVTVRSQPGRGSTFVVSLPSGA
jgi:signal transduction histidine kinase